MNRNCNVIRDYAFPTWRVGDFVTTTTGTAPANVRINSEGLTVVPANNLPPRSVFAIRARAAARA